MLNSKVVRGLIVLLLPVFVLLFVFNESFHSECMSLFESVFNSIVSAVLATIVVAHLNRSTIEEKETKKTPATPDVKPTAYQITSTKLGSKPATTVIQLTTCDEAGILHSLEINAEDLKILRERYSAKRSDELVGKAWMLELDGLRSALKFIVFTASVEIEQQREQLRQQINAIETELNSVPVSTESVEPKTEEKPKSVKKKRSAKSTKISLES